MAAHKIIFVSQEIAPYLSGTDNARWGRSLPQAIQQQKYEVRTFMPDFGDVNERRNQLHEVIRLSGINIPIADNDHPLVIKVASMQPSRIQVYFIDNDDYFQKLDSDVDAFGTNRPDNDERVIFFARGTVETARKLQWDPDVMHVSGWMSALVPLYLKRVFNDGSSFKRTKLVYSVLPETKIDSLDPAFLDKLKADGVKPSDIKKFKEMALDHNMLHKMAITYADAVVFHGVEPDPELTAYCDSLQKPWQQYDGESDHAADYAALFSTLLPSK